MNYTKEISEAEKLVMTRRGIAGVLFCRSFRDVYKLSDLQYLILLGQYYFEESGVPDIGNYIMEHAHLLGNEAVLCLLDMVRHPLETDEEYLKRVNPDSRLVLLCQLLLSEESNVHAIEV